MLLFKRLVATLAAFVGLFTCIDAALAASGQPSPWEMKLQGSDSTVMDSIVSFHHFLVVVITLIVLFVLVLLGIIIFRFNNRANPVPSRTTHNTTLEVIWTIVPVLILAVIAIPSFRLLFTQLDIPKADLTVKATGKQWYWSYSYPDNGNFEFDSIMVQEKDLKPGQPRLLAVDNELVVPVGKVVRVLTTGADVIHSFSVPAFGVKIDAIPGRVNETWFKAEREGTYYGQCSQLCGRDHAFMPIAVHVVSDADFKTWVAQAKTKYSERDDDARTTVASALPAPGVN
ncbi:MAG TPA: cytochrome c oxidase subunit II [Xanthobacteraceae bacterium]|jgi:cytochrome c oxidase subunit 2|nr:cytochrome c oxidase subunit II [Xanthobacteraceae bacterium]